MPKARRGANAALIGWESFRPVLEEHLTYGDQKKGGRIPWCPVLMLKVLVLQRFFDLSDDETVPSLRNGRGDTRAKRRHFRFWTALAFCASSGCAPAMVHPTTRRSGPSRNAWEWRACKRSSMYSTINYVKSG